MDDQSRSERQVPIPQSVKKYFDANKKVLVVEDDKFMGQMIADILDDAGFEVKTANSGMMAFETLGQHLVDFIVLDVLLPEMDGFEIYIKLQEAPDTRSIPVMVITAFADARHRERASELGIKNFLAKPFTEDELLYEILTMLIDHSRKGAKPEDRPQASG
jgi:chemosensory pili system protein ChpA (sensor histidine kinase/response regulator)